MLLNPLSQLRLAKRSEEAEKALSKHINISLARSFPWSAPPRGSPKLIALEKLTFYLVFTRFTKFGPLYLQDVGEEERLY